jgi:hypothetical protein
VSLLQGSCVWQSPVPRESLRPFRT